jgi:predicted ABC-type ATPase
MPELMVIAGPNGAGKSSLTKLSTTNIPVIDPDAIAREITPENPESAALAAGRQAIVLAKEYTQLDRSFIVETTLAGNSYLNLMREVKSLGWSVRLTYIGINNPTTNIQRVRSRVKLGGHDVPRADILRRYERSLVNLSKAAQIADRLDLYDNSTNEGYQLIATIEGDRSIIYVQELPEWIDSRFERLRQRANLNLRSSVVNQNPPTNEDF